MYQICVSGAAKGDSVDNGKKLAYQVGQEIAKAKQTLLTGATTGLPDYAAHGAHDSGGKGIALSPASSRVEHVLKYRLPTDCYDNILYTGLHYVGRDVLLVASSDAVISIGGRLGTLHEFTIAMEMEKPIGFLMGAGGVSDEIKDILRAAGKSETDADLIFSHDPAELVHAIIKRLDEVNKEYHGIYDQKDGCAVCKDLKKS